MLVLQIWIRAESPEKCTGLLSNRDVDGFENIDFDSYHRSAILRVKKTRKLTVIGLTVQAF